MKTKVLDDKDQRILSALTDNARASYSTIAKQVNLSAPAVKERMQKLEDAGIITGYHVAINPQQLGKHIGAFILVAVPFSQEKSFIRFVQKTDDIHSCHHLVGERAFIVHVQLSSMQALEHLLNQCMRFGQTTTHMLLSRVK